MRTLAIATVLALYGCSTSPTSTSDEPQPEAPLGEPGSGPAGGFAPATPGATADGVPTQGQPSNTCITILSEHDYFVATVAIDTGVLTKGPKIAVAEDQHLSIDAIGVRGNEIVACDSSSGSGERRMIVIDRLTGGLRTTQVACDSVTSDTEGIWILPSRTDQKEIVRFPDIASIEAGKSTLSIPRTDGYTRLGTGKDTLYGAWHASNSILTIDRASGKTSTIALEGFDDWIRGLSAVSGGRVAITSPVRTPGDGGIIVFDGTSGKRIGTVGKGEEGNFELLGLSCADQGNAAAPTKLPDEPK